MGIDFRGIPCPVCHRGNLSIDFEPFIGPARLLSGRDNPSLTAWLLSMRVDGPRGHSVPTPIWGALRLRAVRTPIPGHDVSGPVSQTVSRTMQPITTIMPLLQCGHWRRDRPVSASWRSR
jgi:hypothetical protein